MEGHDLDSESLRTELARLQDREATLTHLLNLEREKRVRAEHLFEVERLACFELGHKLASQRVSHTSKSLANGTSAGVKSTELANCDGHYNGVCDNVASDTESVACSIDFQDTSNLKAPRANGSEVKNKDGDEGSVMSSNLSPLSTEGDFASSIFSQLPADLQHMLGVGDEQEAREEEAYTRAQSAVLSNDPDSLRRYVSLPGLTNHKGKSLLEVSCEKGHEGCVRVLVEAGWSPNEVTSDKRTLLHLCAKHGHLNSLKVLVDFGADPNSTDASDQTPIFLALRSGHETTAQSLLETGVLLTRKTKDGLTLLHAAVQGNLPHTLRLLLAHLQTSLEGSEFKQILNFTDVSGSTPLHTAVSGGHRECVGVLCACKGINLSQRDRWNRTPMDVASDEDCRELLRNRESRPVPVLVESPDSFSGQWGRLVIGQLLILPHHRLSDIEPLVADLLARYCDTLRGHSLYTSTPGKKLSQPVSSDHQGSSVGSRPVKVLSERVEAEYELASALKDNSEHVARKDAYLQDCYRSVRNEREKILPLDLAGGSVSVYQVGSVRWRSGELGRSAGSKTLLSVFNEAKLEEKRSQSVVRIILKGLEEGHLDQLAFQLMTPVSRLQEYVDLVKQHKALIIHGSQGSGKTQLAKSLAIYLKATKGKRAQVVYFSLHPSFQRDDLFRLLHLNGLLIQQKESSHSTHVVILDDLSSTQMPSVLAELLTCLEYRGAEHPMWISDVYARDGSLLYPCGHYYLHDSTYFIATTSTESAGGVWVDQFAHISLSLQTSSSVLMHHLCARLVHALRDVALHPTLPLCRMVWWVFQVWVLYNDFVRRIGLQQLLMGVRHFIQCPVEFDRPETVSNWLVSLWNHHLAPAIQSALLTPAPSTPPSQSHTLQDFQLVSKCLLACLEVVFRPACPLSYKARERCMEELRRAIESEGLERRGEKEQVDIEKSISTSTKSESSSSDKAHTSNTPPTSHPTHKPPLPPQPGSMVSYEDMLRDSPRNKAKKDKNKANLAKYSKAMSVDDPKQTSVEQVVLRPHPRKSTLRKLRSKTISLFSKDHSGSSTLPKLFRKGSRTSLNLGEQVTPSNDPNPAQKTRRLEDMFDLLSTANSNQLNNQCSPSPPPEPVANGDIVDDKRKDLDNFLDMLSSVDTSRINEQRSPPPPRTPTKSKSKKHQRESTKTAPRYTVLTGSPLRDAHKHHPNKLLGIRGSSPPAHSTPDIISEVESERASQCLTSSLPVQRRHTPSSLSGSDSDMLFTDEGSGGHSHTTAGTTNGSYQQYNHGPHTESDSRQQVHSYSYDTNTASEPIRRRKPQLDSIVIHDQPPLNKTSPVYGRQPASPLTVAMYSNSSPQGTREQGDLKPTHPRLARVRSIKSNSVADILEGDPLGTIEEFDLFRASSEGDLLRQSPTKLNFDSQAQKNGGLYDKDQVSYSNTEKPSPGYQSSPDEEDSQLDTNSLMRDSVRTSGYGSDHTDSRRRSYSTSVGCQSSSYYHYPTSDRRHSSSYDQKREPYSPTNSLTRGRRQSDNGSNLLYSASLGFNSLTKLCSSRDHLSSAGTDDSATEM